VSLLISVDFLPLKTITRLRAVRRKGVNQHGVVKLSGVSGKFMAV